MQCSCCSSLYNTTIAMQTVGSQGMICHNCIEEAVEMYMKIKNGDIRITPSKMDMGY